MKSLSIGKIWLFATGQCGWALLSGLISNWLVYFCQPDEASIAQGQLLFIPQGLVLMVAASLPMAVFGILSQAVVADIARAMRNAREAIGRGCSMLPGRLIVVYN